VSYRCSVLTQRAEKKGDRDGGRDQTTHRNSLRAKRRILHAVAVP
jgi:hypothetical protein